MLIIHSAIVTEYIKLLKRFCGFELSNWQGSDYGIVSCFTLLFYVPGNSSINSLNLMAI